MLHITKNSTELEKKVQFCSELDSQCISSQEIMRVDAKVVGSDDGCEDGCSEGCLVGSLVG